MGRRSRKRVDPERPPTTRAERDAQRRAAARAGGGTQGRRDSLPPAPWAPVPLTELVVLLALVFGVWGILTFESERGRWMLFAGMVLGSLGGLEVSVREHFAGRRSHTTLLAGALSVATMVSIAAFFALAIGATVVGYTVAVIVGLLAFVAGLRVFRDVFRRRSGGLTFR